MTSQHPPAQDGDLASAAEELYALSPGDFTAARDERVARARTSGNRDLARAIGALRRPAVSAWLVNQLVREAGDQVGELLALGESLRQAQKDLAGDQVRELSAQRRRLVAGLVAEAKRLAERDGRPAGLQVEREVEADRPAVSLGEPFRLGYQGGDQPPALRRQFPDLFPGQVLLRPAQRLPEREQLADLVPGLPDKLVDQPRAHRRAAQRPDGPGEIPVP